MTFREKILNINWFLLVITAVISGVGILAIYSATWMRGGTENEYLVDSAQKQAIFLGIGFAIMLGTMLVDYRWVKLAALPAYLGSLALLVFLYANLSIGPAKSKEVYGATSWIEIGGSFNFQPAQLAIISGIMLLAVLLARFSHANPILKIAFCGVLVAVPAYLIKEQPDLGSTFIWFPVYFVLLFIGGVPLRWIIAMLLAGICAIPFVLDQLDPYQLDRLLAFLDPWKYEKGAGWNMIQSLIAIGSGGWDGKGFKAEGTQTYEGYLPPPIAHNDFIFAVLAEEHGFRGAIVVVVLLAMLLFIGLYIASQARDRLGVLLVAGIIGQFFTYVFMNIGMNIGLLPITGLPLPLISYGGTFLIISLFSLGIVQSVWIHRNAGRDKPQPVGKEIPADENLEPVEERVLDPVYI